MEGEEEEEREEEEREEEEREEREDEEEGVAFLTLALNFIGRALPGSLQSEHIFS